MIHTMQLRLQPPQLEVLAVASALLLILTFVGAAAHKLFLEWGAFIALYVVIGVFVSDSED